MPTLSELRQAGALAEFSAAVAREATKDNHCRLSQQEIETLIDTPATTRQVGGEHYTRLAVQPWDAMQAWMSPEAFRGYLLGNAIKYLARDKGDRLQDLQKAAHYLQRLIEIERDEPA